MLMERVNARVFGSMMCASSLLLALLLLVHVHGDGEAFPESWVADAGHFGCEDLILLNPIYDCDCCAVILCADNPS
jgi:hypothetical protein